jgi:hypothetical protein
MNAGVRRAVAALFALAVTLWPRLALACAGCSVGNGRNQTQFFWTTVFLSLFPLAMLVAIGWWVVRQSRSFIKDEFHDDEEELLEQAHAIRDAMAAGERPGA